MSTTPVITRKILELSRELFFLENNSQPNDQEIISFIRSERFVGYFTKEIEQEIMDKNLGYALNTQETENLWENILHCQDRETLLHNMSTQNLVKVAQRFGFLFVIPPGREEIISIILSRIPK
jgi:hypothetical protein